MAEVSFDTLEALDRMPVPATEEDDVTSGFKSWTTVHGPIKIEWNYYQQAAQDAFADPDTFVSRLVKPILAWASVVNVDPSGREPNVGATLESVESEALYRTVTVHNAATPDGAGLLVAVIGY